MEQSTKGAIVAGMERVAESIQSGPGAAALVMSGYDRVVSLVTGADRKVWGTARQLLTTGWADWTAMRAARAVLGELVEQLVALSRRFGTKPSALCMITAALTLVALAVYAVDRRVSELGDQVTADAASSAPSAATGMRS